MKNSIIAFVVFLVALASPAACQRNLSPDATATAATSGLQQHNPRYQLRKSDSFEVIFSFSPEFNQTVTVEPDGYVTLREIGSIHVEGETVPELTETLKKAYAGILHDPAIAISLKDFDKPYFIATGEVAKPGKYDLRGPLTVTEGVAIAGGFSNKAKHSQVVLFHPTPDGVFEAKLLNVKQLLASRNLKEDIYLRPGDLVYVPESEISKISRFMPNSAVGAYYNPSTY